ncbi:MAG: hypothetical protein ACK5ZY_14185 [Cyclobacteriaceae bacterium]
MTQDREFLFCFTQNRQAALRQVMLRLIADHHPHATATGPAAAD